MVYSVIPIFYPYYEINYAKRVESYSRFGKYTNIFLSEKARNLIRNSNIIFEKYENIDLKGIAEHVNLFEVKEFLFKFKLFDKFDDTMIVLFNDLEINILPSFCKIWLEMYMINILVIQFLEKEINFYKIKIKNIISNSHYIDVVFYKFLKAYFSNDECKTLKLKYYQEIVKENPTFIWARKEIINLYKGVRNKLGRIEPLALEIKNYIDEMKNFHDDLIQLEEKKLYDGILKEINSNLKI